MDFIHPLLAFGAATFAIPVVIHLIFRMRKRRIVFSSLRFLHQSMLKESRRLKLRELILLLLRCLACILIALAFARPFRATSVLAGPNGRVVQDVVLVLDDSPSMSAQEGAGTRWADALNKAREEIAARASGDRVGLVLTSDPGRAEIELSGNFSAVLGALKNDRPSAKRGDLAQAMNTAIDLLAGSTQPRRRVAVFSDFQSSAIDRGEWATLAQKAAGSGSGIAVELQGPATIAQNGVVLPNLAITEVRAKSDVWIEGRPVPFVVRVANCGEAERPSVVVKLVIDGKPAVTRTLGLGPRSSTEVELEALFPRAGEVSGYVEVDAHDCFPDDDRRLFALRLRDSIKVLVIEDKLAEREVFLDQSYFVRMALEPKARGDAESHGPVGSSGPSNSSGVGNYIQATAAEIARVTPEMYRSSDLIVICGITAMNDGELASLEDAVRDGKNLIVFTGRADGRLSDSFYNGAFWKNGLGLLPARPGTLYEGNRFENKFDKIGDFNIGHPLFKPFIGENDANLRLPRYYRHYQASAADLKIGAEEKSDVAPIKTPSPLDPKTPSDSKNPADPKTPADPKVPVKQTRPAGAVLATFTGDGGPFALERPFGKGTVLMFPFLPRPEATDLPKRKAFVPLIHQAVRWLAGVQSASRRSLIVGDNFVFADAGAPPEASISLEKPQLPDGKKETLSLTGNDHPAADALGIYTASFTRGPIKERTLWAVNLDPRESELSSEPLGTLKNIFATVAASEASNAKAAAAQLSDEQKSLASEWRWCLLAALCCLLMEVALRDFWKS